MEPHVEPAVYATAKAYRVKGGAVVTITRTDGATRRHRVNNYRFRWLITVFSLAAERGWFTSSGFDCVLQEPLVDVLSWLKSQRWKA